MGNNNARLRQLSEPKPFDSGDGIIVTTYDFRLFKSQYLNEIDSDFLRNYGFSTHWDYKLVQIESKIGDSLLYLKNVRKSFEIVGSANFWVLNYLTLPIDPRYTKNYYQYRESYQKRLLREKTFVGYEFLHLRTNTKVWVADVAIHFVC